MHERLKSNQFNTCTIAPTCNRLIIILMICSSSSSDIIHNNDDEYSNNDDHDDKEDGGASPHNSSASDGYQGGATYSTLQHTVPYTLLHNLHLSTHYQSKANLRFFTALYISECHMKYVEIH